MLQIRKAELSDSAAIEFINEKALGYDFHGTAGALASVLNAPGNMLFVACLEGQVVGYIHGTDYTTTYCGPLKNILSLGVLPGFHGTGAGKALVAALESWAKQDGAAGVRLVSGTDRTNAHGFYIHMGYAMRKEQKNFIKLF